MNCMSFGTKKLSVLTTGSQAPAFELTGTDERKRSLQQSIAEGPVLAAFFKVGCPTCQFAFPFIERIHKRFNGHQIAIWGVSQDRADDTRSFSQKFGITFPILIDDKPYPVSQSYRLNYTPTLFLIFPEGRVEMVSEGFSKNDLLAIERKLASLLGVRSEPLFLPEERIPEYKPG